MYKNKAVKNFIIFIYGILTSIFLAYFIVLNNSAMILYSLIIFIGLGFLLSSHKNYTENAIIIAVILISSSEITYFVNIFSLLQIYVIIIIIAAIIIPYIVPKALTPYSYLALLMPLLLYFSKFNQFSFFAINVAVIGYYLLISAAISMLIILIFKAGKRRTRKKMRMLSIHGANVITTFVLIAGLILLMAPIWPAGPSHFLTGEVPHIPITIYNTRNVATPDQFIYSLSLNRSLVIKPGEYSIIGNYTLNINSSNFRIFYQNGTEIPALINENKNIMPNGSISILLELNKINASAEQHIKIIFSPLNISPSTYFRPASQSLEAQFKSVSPYPYLKISAGQINGGAFNKTYINESIVTYAFHKKNDTLRFNASVLPYYMTGSTCEPTKYLSATIDIQSNENLSIFASKGIGGISNPGAVNVGKGLINWTYKFYLSQLMADSFAHQLNNRTLVLNASLNGSCVYYYILTREAANLTAKITDSYYENLSSVKTVRIPTLLINQNALVEVGNYSFLSEGINYLIRSYNNETNPIIISNV